MKMELRRSLTLFYKPEALDFRVASGLREWNNYSTRSLRSLVRPHGHVALNIQRRP
jgi:hypothetical protein